MGPTTETPTTSVPQSSGNANSSGQNIAQVLQQILSGNESKLNELQQKASTPVAGGHATQIPASMTQMQQMPGQMHMDNTPVVGAGNARAQGIGNAVRGVVHMLATTETELSNKKKLEVASATQQLLTAQQAFDQASQIVKSDPSNKEAAAAVARNKAIMNGILSNDKLRKSIAKGMNIDFTDPQANTTLEHQGVAQGKQMAQAHASYADQFNEKTPTTMGPNVQAQQQYAAAMQQQKLNTEAVKSLIPLISAQMRQASMDKRTDAMLTNEQLKEAHATALEAAKSQDSWAKLNAQIQARADLAKTQFGFKMREIGAEGAKDLQVFRAKLEMKNADPMSQLKAYNDWQLHSSAQTAKLSSTIAALESEKAATVKDNPGNKASIEKSFDEQINLAKQAQTSFQQLVDANSKLYKAYGVGKDTSNGNDTPSNSTKTGSLSSASTYVGTGLQDDEIESNSDDDTN